MGRSAGVGDAKLWIRLARVAPLLGILMGVRLIPGRRQSKIVAFSGILALVHRPPWPLHAGWTSTAFADGRNCARERSKGAVNKRTV